jgi:hypothetical protein
MATDRAVEQLNQASFRKRFPELARITIMG